MKRKQININNLRSVIDHVLEQEEKEEKVVSPFKEIDSKILDCYNNSIKILNEYKSIISAIDDCKTYRETEEFYPKEHLSYYDSNVDAIEYLIVSSDPEIITNSSIYEKMKHNFYTIKNMKVECNTKLLALKSETLKKQIDVISKNANEITEKNKKIESQYENIGSTILTVVLSVTVVTTSLSVISKLDISYIPLYIVGLTWFAMTIIVFISDLFKYKDYNSKQAKGLYIIISILLFGILLLNVFYNPDLYNPEKCTNIITADEDSE